MNRIVGLASAWALVACALVACAGTAGNNAPAPDAPSPDAPSLDAPADLPHGVYAIPLTTPTGAEQGLVYTAELVASGRNFQMLLDTGSTTVAIAGSDCESCSGVSPRYVPGGRAVDAHDTAAGTYGLNGTGWAGEVYTDDIGLDHGSPPVSVNLVDILIQSDSPHEDFFFAGNAFQGILGAGRDDLREPNTTGYITSLVNAGVTDQIGIELCPSDGTLWLGGFDPGHAGAEMVFTPLLSPESTVQHSSADFYAVDMTAMSLGSADVGLTAALAQGPVVGTGTSLFYIPTGVETQVLAELDADAGFVALFPGQTMTDPTGSAADAGCVFAGSGVTDAMIDDELPPLTLTFAAGSDGSGSVAVTAPALRSYLVDAGGGEYCMGMYPGGDDGRMIMGDTFLRGFVTLIDLVNEQVGFAPDTYCPAPEVARDAGRAFHKPVEAGRGPSRSTRRRGA